jgi:hypothetical protein
MLACPAAGQAQPEGTVPLYLFWSEAAGDNAAVTIGEGTVFRGVYRFVGVQGHIFDPARPAPPGTVPLYEWFSPSRGDSMSTTESVWRDDTADHVRSPDYVEPRRLGYVFDPQQPQPAGTVPLFRWWSRGREDNISTTAPAWRGGDGEARSPDYVFTRMDGFVFPPAGMAPAPVPPPVERRDVVVRLDQVVVHDDCDSITAGDWFIGLQAVDAGRPGEVQAVTFPNEERAIDVDTGETLLIGREVTLSQVPVTNDIGVTVGAIDCDSDSLFAVIGLFPFYLTAWVVSGESYFDSRSPGIALNCRWEEEVTEVSGHEDYVGFLARIVTPAQWQAGSTFVDPVSGRGLDCERGGSGVSPPGGFAGLPTYTATISVR